MTKPGIYQLYGGRYTRAIIVQMVMAEGDIEYEYIELDLLKNEQRQPEFLALNPAGFIPILITPGDEIISETPAINLYLCEQHQLTELYPTVDDKQRGAFLSHLFYYSGDLEPAMRQYFYPHLFALRDEDVATIKQKTCTHALNRFSVIEKRLQTGGPYHLGERFSLLDIILAFWVKGFNLPGNFDDCPAIWHCVELVENRPVIRPFIDTLNQWNDEYTQLENEGGGFK